MKSPPPPHLYVDLDDTLVATDLLHESALRLLATAPLTALNIPLWLLRGKAVMKRRIAERVRLDPATLPYREDVLEMVRQARAQGRRVVLASASDRLLADAVAAHLGLFDHVIASDGTVNLAGSRKLEAIRADAGDRPFSYAGNGLVDVGVWHGAQAAVVVSNSRTLRDRARRATSIEAEIDVPRAKLHDLLYGLRLHQWLKNLLVFVPMLPVIDTLTRQMVLAALAMFFAFGLCASATYIVNDLLDLDADRRHERKRHRPFASGAIPIAHAIALAWALLTSSMVLAMLALPPMAIATLVGYIVLTLSYSVFLKRRMLVDVFSLASLYTLRILAGVAAIGVEGSFWLLGFSMFIFLSLALAKRYVELNEAKAQGATFIAGRAYQRDDGVFVLAAGLASGQLSILTLSLYVNDPAVVARYDHPYVLWLVCPLLLYWLVRMWLKAHRGELRGDPVVFAATDRLSQLVIAICAALVWAAA